MDTRCLHRVGAMLDGHSIVCGCTKSLGHVTKRDFYRAEREMLNEDKRIMRTAEQLCNLGWLAWQGKSWKVNPMVHVKFADRADQERNKRTRDHANIVEKTQRVKEAHADANLEC